MAKIRKKFLSLLLLFAIMFPKAGLIIEHKSSQQMEEDGEVFLGI